MSTKNHQAFIMMACQGTFPSYQQPLMINLFPRVRSPLKDWFDLGMPSPYLLTAGSENADRPFKPDQPSVNHPDETRALRLFCSAPTT